MGFGDFLKSAWGTTEKGVQDRLSEASNAITSAEREIAAGAEKLEQEASKTAAYAKTEVTDEVATTKKNVANAVTSVEHEAKKDVSYVRNLVNRAAGEVAATVTSDAKKLVTGLKSAAVMLQVPDYLVIQTAALIYSQIKASFSPEAIGNLLSPRPLANRQRLINALIKNQDLIAAADRLGIGKDPRVMALQSTADAMAKALMSDDAYNGPDSTTPPFKIPGYTRLSDTHIDSLLGPGSSASFKKSSPNVHAVLYMKDQTGNVCTQPQYTLAFRGTDTGTTATTIKDGITDAQNALNIDPGENGADVYALSLGSMVYRELTAQGATLDLTGHSLTAAYVQAISCATGAKGGMFNGAGAPTQLKTSCSKESLQQNLVNYHVDGEIVTTGQKYVAGITSAAGTEVALPAPLMLQALTTNTLLYTTAFGPAVGVAATVLKGSVALHQMDSVESGMVAIGEGPQSAVSRLVTGR
jgi:hypothetical protein